MMKNICIPRISLSMSFINDTNKICARLAESSGLTGMVFSRIMKNFLIRLS
jgi:hypothetical protein